jgi:Pyruvate/2-oxoacid:ferredoxin oxidoreductase gamma subunit
VVAAISDKFPAKIAAGNIAAAHAAYEYVLGEMREAAHVHAD